MPTAYGACIANAPTGAGIDHCANVVSDRLVPGAGILHSAAGAARVGDARLPPAQNRAGGILSPADLGQAAAVPQTPAPVRTVSPAATPVIAPNGARLVPPFLAQFAETKPACRNSIRASGQCQPVDAHRPKPVRSNLSPTRILLEAGCAGRVELIPIDRGGLLGPGEPGAGTPPFVNSRDRTRPGGDS